MANTPNLSDLPFPGKGITSTDFSTGGSPASEMELFNIRREHNLELAARRTAVVGKTEALERKLTKHELKEVMMDSIIARTYTELENLSTSEFTRRGQKQTILIKQLEALSILHDTLLKYEDMIQKYHKILIDLENNKISSFIKIENLKKEEEAADEGIASVLTQIQELIKGGNAPGISNSVIDDITSELEAGNY